MLRFVYDYTDVPQYGNYIFSFLLRCVLKNFSHLSSIGVILFILRRWCIVCVGCGTVWSGFGGVECAAGGFEVGVCVCVCIVWLLVEGIKWLLF